MRLPDVRARVDGRELFHAGHERGRIVGLTVDEVERAGELLPRLGVDRFAPAELGGRGAKLPRIWSGDVSERPTPTTANRSGSAPRRFSVETGTTLRFGQVAGHAGK